MTRIKPKGLNIATPAEAQEAMLEMLRAKLQIDRIETAMNDAIKRAKENAEAQAGPIKDSMCIMETALKMYADKRKEALFLERRTIHTLYGSYGYRRSSELKPMTGVKLGDVAEICLEKGYADAVKITKSVQKDVIRQWPSEKIAEVKCRIVEKDTFGYELDMKALDKERMA